MGNALETMTYDLLSRWPLIFVVEARQKAEDRRQKGRGFDALNICLHTYVYLCPTTYQKARRAVPPIIGSRKNYNSAPKTKDCFSKNINQSWSYLTQFTSHEKSREASVGQVYLLNASDFVIRNCTHSRLDLLHNYVKNQEMNLVLSVFICVAFGKSLSRLHLWFLV